VNQAGEDIAKRAEWSGLYTSDTIAGAASSHTLPSDFQEMGEKGSIYLNKTEGTFTPLRPIVDPAMWGFCCATSVKPALLHDPGAGRLRSLTRWTLMGQR
jgi:hypothetical protein